MRALTVTNPFDGREIGQQITEPSEIDAILASEHREHVVVVNLPDTSVSAPKKSG